MRVFLVFFLLSICSVLSAQEDTTVYELVDQEAEFPGGMPKMMKWFIDQDIKFEDDYINGLCLSRIKLQFIVEKDGSISNIKSLNTCALSQENAVKLMGMSPKWIPAQNNSNVVRMRYFMPITICFSD